MGARENKCQTSQNDILHMKFSKFSVCFHNSCEIRHSCSLVPMTKFSLMLLHVTTVVTSTALEKCKKRMQYSLNYSGTKFLSTEN